MERAQRQDLVHCIVALPATVSEVVADRDQGVDRLLILVVETLDAGAVGRRQIASCSIAKLLGVAKGQIASARVHQLLDHCLG